MSDRDEEDVNFALWLPADFPMGDLLQTCYRLSESGVCVPGYVPPPVGLYEPDGLFYEQHV